MKLIFLKDVGGVARHNDVKEIADGYALNCLIPNGSAVQATPERLREFEARLGREAAARERGEAELAAAIRDMAGVRVCVRVRATEKGGLFKAIAAEDVRKALEEEGRRIPLSAIDLKKPIKETGEHPLLIMHAGVHATITLAVEAEGR